MGDSRKHTIEREWVASGLRCVVLRIDKPVYFAGDEDHHRCGYVEVPDDHPWFGKNYGDVPEAVVQLDEEGTLEDAMEDFGVLSVFCAAMSDDEDRMREIGMMVRVHGGITYADDAYYYDADGKDNPGTWAFGFDCAHYRDTSDHWTEDAVAAETERMAAQLASVGILATTTQERDNDGTN